MTAKLPSTLLARISKLIAREMGLHFPEARWHDLERGLISAAYAQGFAGAGSYAQSLLVASLTSRQIEELSTHLTIGETYFFREIPAFNALREHILPELIRNRRATTRQLRIWSAGCCTGEEAYSTAILLNQLLPDWQEWKIAILASDINPRFLRRAGEGVYGEWSFRGIPPHIKDRYFTQGMPGRFHLIPAIKQQVRFKALNLVEDCYPSYRTNTTAMDVILCRNVLMYFTPEQAKKVVSNLYNSLAEGGWLIVSLGEASHTLFSQFTAVHFPNAIVYQKKRATHTLLEARIDDLLQANQATNPLAHALHRHRLPANDVHLTSHPHRSGLQPARKDAIVASKVLPEIVAQPPSKATSQGLYEQGRYAEAEEALRTELQENPENAVALVLLARICANQGRLDEALAWCKRSIEADRLNPSSYYLYATIQAEGGEIGEARKSLKQALYLHPDFVLAHFALGHLARRQGNQKEADKHFANMLGLLKGYRQDEILPESDGLTAGRLMEMMRLTALAENLQ